MEKDFKVIDIDLDGSKLIEASAGTGKTYSIALLVLRLIIEKEIPIEKILVVTFTKPAVAELESRIRKFVKLAWKYSSGKAISEEKIIGVVGESSARKAELLKKATHSLDNLSVMTIHSFCNEFITNHPFEVRHTFKTELVTDMSELVRFVANDYWRRKINTIESVEVFRHLCKHITPESITGLLSNALDDKAFDFTANFGQNEVIHLKDLVLKSDSEVKEFFQHIQANWDKIKTRGAGHRYVPGFISDCGNPHVFSDKFLKICRSAKGAPKYYSEYFPEELDKAQNLIGTETELAELIQSYAGHIYSEAIYELKEKVKELRDRKNLISYDDLISVMHNAVMEGTINDIVLKKFSVVFIDEFQDTDNKQYYIFSKIFRNNTTLFYIGDPKQSIYGWRKADINTYKAAVEEVGQVKRMNENFRSTQKLIDALNTIFAIEDPFDDPDISYYPVSKGDIELGIMTEAGTEVVPVSVNSFPNNQEITGFVKTEILRLLMQKDILINGNRIQPSDVAVLVRNRFQASDIKKALSEVNIPSVTIDESSVLSSVEANNILALLPVVLSPDRGGISKVLLNRDFGFTFGDIQVLDTDAHLDRFRELKAEWLKEGIYNMIFSFLAAYNVRRHCLGRGIAGERSLSNYYQLAEILHQVSNRTRCTPEELIVWLQRERESASEEYEQRIESEDNAVQILTIHKSKGLTFRIVFAPFLDLQVKSDPFVFNFRTETGYQFTPYPDEEQLALYNKQTEQENRRLIYVAMTRAQYKLYICENRYYDTSSLKSFLTMKGELFERDIVRECDHPEYIRPANNMVFTPRKTPEIKIENTFGIHSFSALSKAHHSAPFEKAVPGTFAEYDQFIFQDLGRGASVGTALHSIFERLNFSKPDTWMDTIKEASGFWSNMIKEENLNLFYELVSNVMQTEISFGNEKFRLSDIPEEKKLPEMEFLFSVDRVNKKVINDYLGDDATLGGEADIEGLMTGFMDLMFEYNGKYHILDWKSNHLGNDADNYDQAGMDQAMTGSNYHLQYMIYTVAAVRWLKTRVSDFDYDRHFGGIIYVFLRGVRDGKETGIYTRKPEKKTIEKLDAALGGLSEMP